MRFAVAILLLTAGCSNYYRLPIIDIRNEPQSIGFKCVKFDNFEKFILESEYCK